MKKSTIYRILQFLSIALVLSTAWLAIPSKLTADDAPPLGESTNWDSDGVEWQYYSRYSQNSINELWTYWISGTTNKTIGPGLQTVGRTYLCGSGIEFSGSCYAEAGQDVYIGKIVFSEGAESAVTCECKAGCQYPVVRIYLRI